MGRMGRRTRPGGNPVFREQLRRWVGAGRHGPWRVDVPAELLATYLHLLERSDRYGTAPFDSRAKLAEDLGRHPCTVSRHIARLEELGLVEVVRAPVIPRLGRRAPLRLPRGAAGAGHWKRAFTNRYRFCRPPADEQTPAPAAGDRAAAERAPAGPPAPHVQLLLADGDVVADEDIRPPPRADLSRLRTGLAQARAALPSR